MGSFVEYSQLPTRIRYLWGVVAVNEAHRPPACESLERARGAISGLGRHRVRHLQTCCEVFYGKHVSAGVTPDRPLLVGLDHVIHRDDIAPRLNRPRKGPRLMSNLPELPPHTRNAVGIRRFMREEMGELLRLHLEIAPSRNGRADSRGQSHKNSTRYGSTSRTNGINLLYAGRAT